MDNTRFTSLIDEMIKSSISDLHLTGGLCPYVRNKIGDIVPVEKYGIVTEKDIETILNLILGRAFDEHTLDTSYAQ